MINQICFYTLIITTGLSIVLFLISRLVREKEDSSSEELHNYYLSLNFNQYSVWECVFYYSKKNLSEKKVFNIRDRMDGIKENNLIGKTIGAVMGITLIGAAVNLFKK